jgi:hypothetical protein
MKIYGEIPGALPHGWEYKFKTFRVQTGVKDSTDSGQKLMVEFYERGTEISGVIKHEDFIRHLSDHPLLNNGL